VSDRDSVIHVYDQQARFLAAQYTKSPADQSWAWVREFLPEGAGRMALDVGAGVGQDSAWLKYLGFEVIAAEPSSGMRLQGELLHPGLRWLDDRLPELSATHRLGLSFDLILLSAVWMHVAPPDRARAFRKIVTLLKPVGVLVMTLRHGPAPPDRPMHPAPQGEVEQLARDHGLAVVRAQDGPDGMGRPGVSWTGMCLRLPDDGSGGLHAGRGRAQR
jgi:SAM-dependent methyltransferase